MRAALLWPIITGPLTAPVPAVAMSADAVAPARVEPQAQAHAHNDYEHDRPLHDALDHGFTSVEADVYLVDGELLVAHDPWDVRPERSLRSLYLDPLRERVHAGHGSVYPVCG